MLSLIESYQIAWQTPSTQSTAGMNWKLWPLRGPSALLRGAISTGVLQFLPFKPAVITKTRDPAW